MATVNNAGHFMLVSRARQEWRDVLRYQQPRHGKTARDKARKSLKS